MAKLLVQHDTDPGICVILAEVEQPLPGWAGDCTQCGTSVHSTRADEAVAYSVRHVESHEDAR